MAVGSSNCADACKFQVQFFDFANGKLLPVPTDSIVPPVAAAEFIEPGKPAPKALKAPRPLSTSSRPASAPA